jgi:quinol monooxygenase YgiN
MPAVHAEEGCLEYQPVIDVPDMGKVQAPLGPDTFMVLEKWASREALIAHGASPHMVAYGRKTKDQLASRAIHILQTA